MLRAELARKLPTGQAPAPAGVVPVDLVPDLVEAEAVLMDLAEPITAAPKKTTRTRKPAAKAAVVEAAAEPVAEDAPAKPKRTTTRRTTKAAAETPAEPAAEEAPAKPKRTTRRTTKSE
jgi:ribonuclease E